MCANNFVLLWRIIFTYIFNRHFKFNTSLYLYNFFHPIFCGLLWILYIFREEKSVQITKRFHFIFFCSYAMFKPVKILLFKAENINETISNSDKILMCLYLLIAVCAIIKALISLNELYDNLKKPEKNS
ncbi:hypothetical protein C4803_22495 [Salmonella enterica subsp. arizonae serovar 51:g,z51:-]|nr:hypothetical protein C4803_22495 [Salmonella enterica subsp. arizonae serovar 51:g,z51:-]